MQYLLHEAIARVLAERQPAGLTVTEITRIISERDWYRQKDGTALTLQQTHARIRNYKHLFEVNRSTRPATVRLRSESDELLSPKSAPLPRVPSQVAEPQVEHNGAPTNPVLGWNPSREWFWEGNIQRRLADFLAADGWSIEQQADTSSRSRGMDLMASKGSQVLVAEVKGYPSVRFARGVKRGQLKPTRPQVQARHWFAGALHAGLRYRATRPSAHVVLVFPDFPTYRRLFKEAMPSLRQASLQVYLIAEDGKVNTNP